jgi:hypothetical protein
MVALIDRCLNGDNAAWSELWTFLLDAAQKCVERIVARCGLDISEADDVTVEIYLHLRHDRSRRLHDFQGRSREDLKNWLRALSCNFARNWARKRMRRICNETKARKAIWRRGNRSGSTEGEILALLHELEEELPPQERKQLQFLLCLDQLDSLEGETSDRQQGYAKAISDRTLRYWRKQLKEKCRVYFFGE